MIDKIEAEIKYHLNEMVNDGYLKVFKKNGHYYYQDSDIVKEMLKSGLSRNEIDYILIKEKAFRRKRE